MKIRELGNRFTLYSLIALSLPLLFIATGAVQADDLSGWFTLLPEHALTVETALRIGDQFLPEQVLVLASGFRQ